MLVGNDSKNRILPFIENCHEIMVFIADVYFKGCFY